MIVRVAASLVVATATMSAAVYARDFLYPWKPGVDLHVVGDDQQQCMTIASGVRTRVQQDERERRADRVAPPPPVDSKAWLAPGLDAQTAFFGSYYDCLRGRGYSIRRMPAAEYRQTKKAGGLAVMQAMAAAQTSHAEVPVGVIR